MVKDHSVIERENPLLTFHGLVLLLVAWNLFFTHPCRRQPLKIVFISNDRGRSLFEAFDWLFICDDPSDVYDLRVMYSC